MRAFQRFSTYKKFRLRCHLPLQHQLAMMPSFLDLPRELRDKIYHYAWLQEPAITLRNDDTAAIVAWYDCTPPATSQNVPDLENLPA
jgi:hypothetical protein